MILVTGGAGYLGSHITRQLAQAGESVRVLVRDRERAQREGRLAGISVDWVEGDVTRPETLKAAMEDVRAVIHTVAVAIERGAATYEEINTQGTINVVQAANEAGIKRLINLSQLGANPDLPYRFLASKGSAQRHVAQSDLDWTAFRPSVIWGPEDEFANTFARLVKLTPIIFPIVGGPDALFQPVWVDDVASAVVKSINDPGTYREEYELGGPEVLTLEEIERRTLMAVGAKRWLIHFPMPVIKLAVSLMERVIPNPPVTSSLLELLAVSNVTSSNALGQFVSEPRYFTSEAASEYMRNITIRQTLRQLLGQ